LSGEQQYDPNRDEHDSRNYQKRQCSSQEQEPRVFISHAAPSLMSAMGGKRTLEMGWREEAWRFYRVSNAYLEALSVAPPNLSSASRSRNHDLARVCWGVLHFFAAKAAPATKSNFNHRHPLSHQEMPEGVYVRNGWITDVSTIPATLHTG